MATVELLWGHQWVADSFMTYGHDLRADIARTTDMVAGGRFRRSISAWRSPGVHAVAALRLGQWVILRTLPVRILLTPIYLLLFRRSRGRWGIEIPRATVVGPGLYVGHSGCVVISPEARIGSNVTLSHDVTIGIAGHGEARGAPIIEDDVYIAPGARLSGPLRIGRRARIGPNALVFRDVPAGAKVVAPECRVILPE
jgi:serine O-acetyltransferase